MTAPTGNPPHRPKGSTNKQTLDVKELAQDYTAEAVEGLASIMRSTDAPPAAKVAAIKELLDRAHGKAKQSVDVDANVKAHVEMVEWTVVAPQAPGA